MTSAHGEVLAGGAGRARGPATGDSLQLLHYLLTARLCAATAAASLAILVFGAEADIGSSTICSCFESGLIPLSSKYDRFFS